MSVNTGMMSDQRSPSLKVGRLIKEYDFEPGFGERLEHRWTADAENRLSLRELADLFNQHLLEETMRDHDMEPLAGEVENIYELLTDEDVSSADRTRTQRRLKREGIEVDKMTDDFVSYQAIRTYLKEHRGAEYSRAESQTDAATRTIQQLRSRTATITESKLTQLEEADFIDIGKFRVMVDVRIICEDCGARYAVSDILERDGCECKSE